jgi:hypothetical protein
MYFIFFLKVFSEYVIFLLLIMRTILVVFKTG